MVNDKLQLHRDYYSLERAAVLLGRDQEDLIYLAATAQLPIYIIAGSWYAETIKESDRIFDGNKQPRTITGTSDIDPMVTIDRSDGKFVTYQYDRANYDFDLGPIRVLSKTGGLSVFYKLCLSGPQLLTADCIKMHRDKAPDVKVEIDLNPYLKIPENYPVVMSFIPSNEMLFATALENDLIVVMANDIRRLIGQTPDENLSAMFEHPYWPNELGIAFAAWLNARESYKPGDKPSAHIRAWLRTKYPTKAEMSDACVDRIAIVANWEKKPGPAEQIGEE